MKILYTIGALVAIATIALGVASLGGDKSVSGIFDPTETVQQDEYVDNTGDVVSGLPKVIEVSKGVTESNTSSGTLFSHPSDGYSLAYDASKLEVRVSTVSEFSADTGLKPSSNIVRRGGYIQEGEIWTYQGTIEKAQEAFIGAYRLNFDPQILRSENTIINGNNARIVTYQVSRTYPEAKLYLIAHGPVTIVASGDYDVVSTIIATEVTSAADVESAAEARSSDWVRYQIPGKAVSFRRPRGWTCTTQMIHIDHPDWLQTLCFDGGEQLGDPNLAFNTPYVDSGRSGLEELSLTTSTETVLTSSGEEVTKKVFTSRAFAGSGNVAYQSGLSETFGSFFASASYAPTDNGSKKYSSQAEAEAVLDEIVRSVKRF